MSKISPNMIRNICSVKNVTDMFLNFDKYKDYFDEGSKEEYLDEIRDFVNNVLSMHNTESSFIMEKDTIPSIIRIYKKFFCSKDALDEMVLDESIFSLLREYENLVNIAIIRRDGPCSFKNNDLRNKALEVAGIQLEEIKNFIKQTKYKDRLIRALHDFDSYIASGKAMNETIFNKFDNLIKKAGVTIPQEYVDLYFKQILVHKKNVKYASLKNAISSMALNLAESKEIECKFEVKKIDLTSAGVYDNGIITISVDELLAFTRNPVHTATYFFETLFHEFRHLVQDTDYKLDRKFSYNDIRMLKDELLFFATKPKFGKENYLYLSYELDAREMSRIYASRYLKGLGANYSKDAERINLIDAKKHGSSYRVIDYKLVPVDHLFDEFFRNLMNIYKSDYAVDILEEYPVLKLMYDESGKRYSTCTLFKMREEAKKKLTTASKKEFESLENKIYNLNQILYNQDLSFVNLVADFKEMVNDTELEMDVDEKITYMQEYLYKRVNERSKRNFIDMSIYYATLFKRKLEDVVNEANTTISTGKEMLEIFHEWFEERGKSDSKESPKLTNKSNKNH